MGLRSKSVDNTLGGFPPLVAPLVSSFSPLFALYHDPVLWGVMVDRLGREMYISAGVSKKDFYPVLVLYTFMQGTGTDSFSPSGFSAFCQGFALCSINTSINWFRALQHSKLIEVSHKAKRATYYKMTEKGTFKLNAILYGLNQRCVQRAEYWSAYLDKRPIRRELFKVDRDWLRGLNPQKVTKPVPELYDHCPQF